MSKIEKLIEKIIRLPPEMDLKEVKKILEYFGWNYESFGKGSHIKFNKKGEYPLITSIHKGKVKREFLKDIVRVLNLEEFNGKNN